MIDIVLLMDGPEAAFFQHHIGAMSSGLNCRQVTEKRELENLVSSCSSSARLISFCADIIVPVSVLTYLKFNCYNFHPGPPERKGYRPAHFAAHENADRFGVTLHRMAPKVDEGAIIAVKRFALKPPLSIEALEVLTYETLVSLAMEHLPELVRIDRNPVPVDANWSGTPTTRRQWLELPLRDIDAS